VDLVTAEGGTVEVWENLGGRAGGVLELTLEGRGGGQAQGALVEVRSGPLYQRRRCDGLAMTFGLGEAAAADRVRVTWTDGTVSYALQPPPDAPLVLRP